MNLCYNNVSDDSTKSERMTLLFKSSSILYRIKKYMYNNISYSRKIRITHKKLVVDSLDNDLLGRVLRHVESELERLVVTLILDQGAVESVQPGVGVVLRAERAVLARLLLCRRAEIPKQSIALVQIIFFSYRWSEAIR